jgi:hypothetical protein
VAVPQPKDLDPAERLGLDGVDRAGDGGLPVALGFASCVRPEPDYDLDVRSLRFFLWIALAAETVVFCLGVIWVAAWGWSLSAALLYLGSVAFAVPTAALLAVAYAAQGVQVLRRRHAVTR